MVIFLLVGWYVGQTGQLPFTWADGPFGIPVWAPIVVLALAIVVSVAVPVVLSKLSLTGPTFRDEIAVNRRNSVFLTLSIAAGLGLAAYVIAALVTLRTSAGLVAAAFAIAAALLGALISLWKGDELVLAVSQAKPVAEQQARELTDVVSEMATAADVPPPKVYLITDSAPNAFSIGRNPRHAALAVTTGLLSTMDREQLQGVVAHEMAHIRNEDTRYSLFVAVLAGATVLIGDGFFKIVTLPFQAVWSFVKAVGSGGGRGFSGGSGSGGSWHLPSIDVGGDSDGKGAGGVLLAIVAVIIFVLLVIAVAWVVHLVTPLFDRIIQAAVSREREYLADATAVELGRNPEGLEQALVKVATSSDVLEVANRATAALYFVNPIRAFEDRAESIYSTHPPILSRVNRLRQLEGEAPLDSIPDAVDID